MISDRAKRAAREGILGSDQSDPEIRAPQSQQADLEQSEDSAALFRLVDRLAEDQRLVLRMRFAEERSISEIAHTLGRSEGAIKQLQFRALENVRKRLASGE
jgi:RNA polymerase sigma-70 factor (ECF subfamily)